MRPLGEIDVQLVDNLDTAWEMAAWLSELDRVAIDTETSGLSPERDIVRLISFGDEDVAYVIPFEDPFAKAVSTTEYDPGKPDAQRMHVRSLGWGGFAAEILRKIADDPDGPQMDMHNAPFDHSMINSTTGIWLPRGKIDDTRLMLHVLDSRNPLGLKQASRRFVDVNANLGQELLDNAMGTKTGWSWANVPIGFKPYWFYAGLDVILTTRLRKQLLPEIEIDAPRSYALELAVGWPCEDMERKGVRIDRSYTQSFLDELDVFVQQTEAWCDTTYGIYPGSDAKVTQLLLNDGVNLIKKTPSGAKFSLDKEVLSGLDHPLAQAVLRRRQGMKIASYLRSYLKLADSNDIIHPDINTVGGISKNPFESGGSGQGVRTGRMSMSNPNLQNVPTRTKEGARIRKCFIPREGNTWIKVDADQIESRILAHVTQDPGLIHAFQEAAETGGDFFVNVAKQMFNDPDFQKSDPRRQLVKNSSYAKVYGAGIPKFAKTAGIDIESATAFMHTYDAMFAEVPAFIRKLDMIGRKRYADEGEAYVRSSLTGRKLTAEARKMYVLMNYLIQGMAGEVLKLKIVESTNAGLDKYALFPVHDEIDLDVPTDRVPEALDIVSRIMNDDKLLSVPITWSADIGPSWGECKG